MGDWKVPAELKYAKTDEWFSVDGNVVTIGITDYAQDQLNDIVYVEFKDPGDSIAAGDSFGEWSPSRRRPKCTAPLAARSSR